MAGKARGLLNTALARVKAKGGKDRARVAAGRQRGPPLRMPAMPAVPLPQQQPVVVPSVNNSMKYGPWGCSQLGRSTHNATVPTWQKPHAPYVTTQMEAHTPLPDANTPA